jgi:hypothetical protein
MPTLDLFPDPTPRAEFSPDRQYRYVLRRDWAKGEGIINFILLNPSTADETTDDPTIRRCIGFARRLGYSGLIITNIFAYRATLPKAMLAAADPVGPGNDAAVMNAACAADKVVCGWGVHGAYRNRGHWVRGLLTIKAPTVKLHCFGLTSNLQPRHPLYIPNAWEPRPLP